MYEFDFDGTDPLTLIFHQALHGQGRSDSWALRWFGVACLNGKLSLYPGESLVSNIGFDGSGRHAPAQDRYAVSLATRPLAAGGGDVRVNPDAFRRYRELFRRWRIGRRRRLARYYAVVDRLPRAIQKVLYSLWVRRSLRKIARR
jgi:hypothetical protein